MKSTLGTDICIRCQKEPRSGVKAKYCYSCKDELLRLRVNREKLASYHRRKEANE